MGPQRAQRARSGGLLLPAKEAPKRARRRRKRRKPATNLMQTLSRTSQGGSLSVFTRVLRVEGQRKRSAGQLELPFGVAFAYDLFAYDLVQSEHVLGCARCLIFEWACCYAAGLAASSGIHSVFLVVRANVPASRVQFWHAWSRR